MCKKRIIIIESLFFFVSFPMLHTFLMYIRVNGVELYYEVIGEGYPLVMLHGNREDCSIFDASSP